MNPLEHLAVNRQGMQHEVRYRKILSHGELSKVVIWWSWKDNGEKLVRQYFTLPDGMGKAMQWNKIMDGKFVEVTE